DALVGYPRTKQGIGRVFDERHAEDQHTTGAQHATKFAKRRSEFRNVLEHFHRNHRIHAAIFEAEPGDIFVSKLDGWVAGQTTEIGLQSVAFGVVAADELAADERWMDLAQARERQCCLLGCINLWSLCCGEEMVGQFDAESN